MTYFIIKAKLSNGAEFCNKTPDGIRYVCESLVSKIPDINEIKEFSSSDSFIPTNDQIIKIIKDYINRKMQFSSTNSSLSIGDLDYKPIAFLERAFRLSASVCRITRSYSFKEFEELTQNWGSQDVPEINRVLEKFIGRPNKDFCWEKYWEAHSNFKKVFASDIWKECIKDKSKEALFIPYATGFLVGKSHLLTNCHVLNRADNEQEFDKFRVQFGYERNLNNREFRPIEYKLDSSLCISCPNLDYTLIKLKDFPELDSLIEAKEIFSSDSERKRAELRRAKLSFEKAGENFGWLRMKSNQVIIPPIQSSKIRQLEKDLPKYSEKELDEKRIINGCKLHGIPGDPICIIQHPRGRAKEIVVFNSYIKETSQDFIQYTADADIGSSGSPILNADLQLIGIHNGALIHVDSHGDHEVKTNLGTRISSIVKHLIKKKSTYPGLAEFINDYIDCEQILERRIFLLGGLERGILKEAQLSKNIVEMMIKNSRRKKYESIKIIDVLQDIKLSSKELGKPIARNPISIHDLIISSDKELLLKFSIAWMNAVCDFGDGDDKATYRPGDIAIEILTDTYAIPPTILTSADELNSFPRGAAVYYISDNRERRAHAESILDKLSEKIPEIRSRGAISDLFAPNGSLAFCRDLYMPSIVLYLGFLENPLDREVLGIEEDGTFDENKIEKLAEAILDAVVAWSDALSPGSWSPN